MDVKNVDVSRLKILERRILGFQEATRNNRLERDRLQTDQVAVNGDLEDYSHSPGVHIWDVERLNKEKAFIESELQRVQNEYEELGENHQHSLKLLAACERFLSDNRVPRDAHPIARFRSR